MRQVCLWFCGMALLFAAAAAADTAVLTSGETVEGRVQAEALTVQGAQGQLVIPVSSMRTVRFDGARVTVVLTDGQELAGELVDEAVELDRGLFASSFAPEQLAELRLEERRPTVELPQGMTLRLVLGERLTSDTVKENQEVLVCLGEDVRVGEAVVLRRGTPAVGRVTRAQDAGAMSRQGEVAVAPEAILAAKDKVLPVSGSGEFEGGVPASNYTGLLGLFSEGLEAEVPAGVRMSVVTAGPLALEPGAAPGGTPEQQEACEAIFRWEEAEVIPLEEITTETAFLPRDKHVTVTLPLAEIKTQPAVRRSLRSLVVSDTFIQSLNIVREDLRKAVELEMRIILYVLPSHDRYVDLTLSVLDGDRVLAREVLHRVDAEEKKTKLVTRRLKVDHDAWDQAVAAGTGLWKLEMTVNN